MAVLPFEGAPKIAALAATFTILACALFWYLFIRYKNFKLSKLFVKNPNLSLLLFTAGFWRAPRRGIFGASVRPAGARRLHLRSRPFV